ncbi:MAG: hypothetical protein LAT66_09025 [Alkalimonas sp.]|nr:hypothetical protein [Alkalimonas sp.]
MHARQYIATLQPQYLNAYNELVEQKQGQRPAADGRRLSYMERLREMNFSSEELQQLQRSNQLSMALDQGIKVSELLKGPKDQPLASRYQ